MVDFFKNFKNVIFDDYYYLYNFFKNKTFKDLFFLFFIILPIVSFFIFFYIFTFIIFLFFYIFYFFYCCIKKYFFYKDVNPLMYQHHINNYYINNFINYGDNLLKIITIISDFYNFCKIIFYDVPKQNAYYYVYSNLKFFKFFFLKKKNESFLNFFNLLIIFFLKFILRYVLFLIISYSLFVIKISINFFNSFKKLSKLNYDSKYTFIQYFLFDFAEKYVNNSYKSVRNKKIIFFNEGVTFNPLPPKGVKDVSDKLSKQITNWIDVNIKIDSSKLVDLQNALKNIGDESVITYSILENKNEQITEVRPHVTSQFNINEEQIIMNRGTTKQNVRVQGFGEHGDKIVEKNMNTHSQYKGTLDPNKIEFKTDIIQADTDSIKNIGNSNLLRNLQQNPTYKDIFSQALLRSIGNPVYNFDKSTCLLYQDPKYKTFSDKIMNDETLKGNVKIKESLDIINKIYLDNLEILKFEKGDRIFDLIIRILILNKDNLWDKELIATVISLLDN